MDYKERQTCIYEDGMMFNRLPLVTTDPTKLEEQARQYMTSRSFDFVSSGAAFRQWKIIPRMLCQTTHRDLSVKLFGLLYKSPVIMAPIGVQAIYHDDKELGSAEVAASLGIPYIHSTAATSSIEEVAYANGSGHCWFQLYWPKDNELTKSLLSRAKQSGYEVLVVTLDTWTLAWRPGYRVGDGLVVLFDSGIRIGSDIVKALCLGAKAVLVGRPWVYGLGIGGKKGAQDVLLDLLADLDLTLGLARLQGVQDCKRTILRKVACEGDIGSTY
ncbi:hypothetical protein MKX08_002753 [Trichoderma sp. CBMAI-0020]|nr:hypothetical protein MKX08_002753 [Trichoderma sp. CBMAI-0020]